MTERERKGEKEREREREEKREEIWRENRIERIG